MKKYFLIAISLLCAFPSFGKSLRVGSFNLWRSDLGKGEYVWANRKAKLVQAIKDINYDIFGAEEVDTTMIRELPLLFKEAGLNYRMFIFSPYKADGGVGNKAQAIIYNPERLEMLQDNHFWYSETPDVMSGGWDEMKFKRGGCCAVFKDLATGRKFFFMLSHMPLGKEANLHAAQIVLDKAAQYNTGNLPALFVGDLNTRPQTQSTELLRTYWTDTYLSLPDKKKEGPCGTFNSHNVKKPFEKFQRIDYIYYKGKVKPLRYVCFTKTYDGIYPSDHCPIYADVKIR